MATTLDAELDQLKSDVTNLRNDIGSLVAAMKDAGIEQGRQYYGRAQERARKAGESARQGASKTYGVVGKEIEERPLTSVMAAFGTGFVVGMLLDRRRHH